jgi:hypothetical protein
MTPTTQDGGRTVNTAIQPAILWRLVVLLGVVLLAACGSGEDDSSSESSSTTTSVASTTTLPSAPTAEEAIAAHLTAAGVEYAGDCAGTNLDEDVGKQCSRLEDDRGSRRIYATGPTFSEFDAWLLLERGPEGWSVIDEASAGTLDDPQAPPW